MRVEAKNSGFGADLEHQIDSLIVHLSQGLGKVATGFVRDALIGMELAHSPRLSDIARALEESIGRRATHKRLSRNAARSELAPILSDNLLRLAASHVHDDTLLCLDWPVLLKKRADKMENLTLISNAKGDSIGKGYHLAEVAAAEIDTDHLMPLAQSIWPEISAEADFLRHTLELVARVRKAAGDKGIIVADRSADHMGLLEPWTADTASRYIVRLRLHTELIYQRRVYTVAELVATCDTRYGKHVLNINGSHSGALEFIDFGYKHVRLPAAPDRLLSLVVVRGLKPVPVPVALLTTEPVRDNRSVLTNLIAAYYMRWRVVATKLRFQERYRLSDIRVLSYERIRNLTTLLHVLEYIHTLDSGTGDSAVFEDSHLIDRGVRGL